MHHFIGTLRHEISMNFSIVRGNEFQSPLLRYPIINRPYTSFASFTSSFANLILMPCIALAAAILSAIAAMAVSIIALAAVALLPFIAIASGIGRTSIALESINEQEQRHTNGGSNQFLQISKKALVGAGVSFVTSLAVAVVASIIGVVATIVAALLIIAGIASVPAYSFELIARSGLTGGKFAMSLFSRNQHNSSQSTEQIDDLQANGNSV